MTDAPQPLRVLVCVGPNCDAAGRGRALHADLEAAIDARFPQARAQGRLRLDTRACLRLCTREPVVRLEPSGDAFAGADVDDLICEIARALD